MVCSPLTWNEHHHVHQSRCTFLVDQSKTLRNAPSRYSLGHSTALLVETHVFQELQTMSGSAEGFQRWKTHIGRVGDGS